MSHYDETKPNVLNFGGVSALKGIIVVLVVSLCTVQWLLWKPHPSAIQTIIYLAFSTGEQCLLL